MNQMIRLSITIIFLILFFYSNGYVNKKDCEYKNDEWWLHIKMKGRNIAIKYLNALFIIASIGLVGMAITGKDFYVSLERVLTFGVLFYSGSVIVEALAIKYYHKKLN